MILDISFNSLSKIAQAYIAIEASGVSDSEKLSLREQLNDRTSEVATRILDQLQVDTAQCKAKWNEVLISLSRGPNYPTRSRASRVSNLVIKHFASKKRPREASELDPRPTQRERVAGHSPFSFVEKINQTAAKLALFTGKKHLYGSGEESEDKDYAQAKKLLEQALVGGSDYTKAVAHYCLGKIYLEGGHGIAKDYAQAEVHFKKALASEYPHTRAEAHRGLATIYSKGGHGIDKNTALAKTHRSAMKDKPKFTLKR